MLRKIKSGIGSDLSLKTLIVIGLLSFAKFGFGDYTVPQPGTVLTGFDFTCFSTKHCPAQVPIDSTGTEKFTSGNPGNVTAKTDQTTHGTTDLVASDLTKIGGSAVIADPCQVNARTYTPINISTAANIKIVTGTSSKKTYLCHLFLLAAGADNIGIVEGTGTNCATGTAGVIGGATAAAGINLAANQGWVAGTGGNAVAATATNADDFCLITSAAVQVSGVAVTVQQ